MEKYIEIFCKQNPLFDFECPKCHFETKIPTKKLLKIKYKYTTICPKCQASTTIDTHDFYKKLEPLKKFSK